MKKIGNNPVSRNLDRILGGPDFVKNLELIEDRTGLSRIIVRHWISGFRNPQLANLRKIADLFNFNVYVLFSEPQDRLLSIELLSRQREIMEMVIGINDAGILDAIESIAKSPLLSRQREIMEMVIGIDDAGILDAVRDAIRIIIRVGRQK